MQDFYSLSSRGRALRLRQLVKVALQHYDLDVKQIRLVSNHYNGIFRVDTLDGKKYVVRVCLPYPQIDEQLTVEMAWLRMISQQSDLRVPEPILTRDGALMVEVETAGVPEKRHCVVFSWLEGADLGDRLTVKNMEKFGAFAARLHMQGVGFSPPPGTRLRAADKVFHFNEPVILFDDFGDDIMPESRRVFFQMVVDRIQAAFDRLKDSGEPMRVLHGDLHSWNVRAFRGQIAAFDFEELLLGWPVQDIGTTMYYFYGHENFSEIRAAFQRGYESVAPWPEHHEGDVDTFIAGRNMVLVNTVLHQPKVDEGREVRSFIETSEQRLRALFGGEAFYTQYW